MKPRVAASRIALCLCAAITACSHAAAGDAIYAVRFHPDAAIEINTAAPSMNATWPKRNYPDTIFRGGAHGYGFTRPGLWGDRCEYWSDDATGQFFALLAPPQGGVRGHAVSIRLIAAGRTLAQVSRPAEDHRVSFLVRMADLPPGAYRAAASFVAPDGRASSGVEFAFVKTGRKNPAILVPAEGIPVRLEPQSLVPDAAWGVRAGIPLPINAVMDPAGLALFEDGRQVPAEVRARAAWCPDGAVQWIHLDFIGRYRDGKPAEYRLKLLGAPPSAASTLKVLVRDEEIAVDTGAAQFTVNRKKFAGISFAADGLPAGGGGPAQDSGGPYLVDEKGQRFEPDATTEVVVEEQGPVKVVIAATGWYANASSAERRLCRFVTRITAFAGQPLVRFSHQTYITYDTRSKQLADLGFRLNAPGAKSFQLGADGRTLAGALPPAPQTVFLHQDRWDHFRLVGGAAPAEGKVSDGWFSLQNDSAARMTVFLRDIWQKYPKEVELSVGGATLHFWPKHGRRTFSQEEELLVKNVYKFLCFHHGALLDLQAPACYVARFEALSKTETGFLWREMEKAATMGANAQGVVISNDFAVLLPDGGQADAAAVAKLFDFDPAATAAPEWNAATGALGPMAAADRENFPDMEDAVEKGLLSWARSVERNDDYGMFNYADTHAMWIVPENRPGLQRAWQSSQYHNVGIGWLLWYRSGSPDLLRWARKSTDHWMNVDVCNYVGDPPLPLRQHALGAMQHAGWMQHWAGSLESEPWSPARGVAGHFIDPDAALWCWYLSGNERAREAYSFWQGSYRKEMCGLLVTAGREPINTLAYAITDYQAGRDPALLPVIYTMAQEIRTLQPLEDQRPGPLCHPFWMNRYYQQTRDPQYVPFILKYADLWTSDESIWTLALCAQAFDLSNDRKFLDKHFPLVNAFPRAFFRRAGHPYDWFAYGPGPLGDGYAAMSWGCFLGALKQAGVETIPDDARPEALTLANATVRYLVGDRSKDASPGTVVLALKTDERAVIVRLAGRGYACDLHRWHSRVTSPAGTTLHDVRLPEPNAKAGVPGEHEERLAIAPAGEKGCYRIELSEADGAILAPATDLPFEAQWLDRNREYSGGPLLAWLCPGDGAAPVTLTFTALPACPWGGPATSVRVEDAGGKRLCDKSLWAFDERCKTARLTLDPKVAPPPWKLDITGRFSLTWTGRDETMLLGMNRKGFPAILSALRNVPPAK